MVKTIEAYECETCENPFMSKKEAQICEKEHLDGEKMEVDDVFYKTANEMFPDEILISCSNHSGVQAMYTKTSEGSVEEYAHLYEEEE